MWHRRLAGVILLLWVGGTYAAVGGETPRWLRELHDQAAQGDLGAQYTLGVRYAHGQGVARDPAAAVRWLRRAAGQGKTAAQFLLGGIYYRGEGGQPDFVQAYIWATLAAAGLEGPIQQEAWFIRDLAAARLTPEQLDHAQQLIDAFPPVQESE